MKTFTIKTIHWPSTGSEAIQRYPNVRQMPKKNVVYTLPTSKTEGIPLTLNQPMSAWVHTKDDKWYWTPVSSVTGSYRLWDSYEIEIEDVKN
jgi:hypothetical protein